MSKASKQQDQLINLQAQQLAAQIANWAATLDFQKERFRLLELPQFQQNLQLDVDKFAWQKAEDTWKQAYQESLVTGYYQGKPTTQWLLDQAKLTGSYNGERTLEGKLTDAQIQDMHDKMKLANDEFVSSTTGYFNGQKTFDRQKFEAAQALDGWKFIATLSGPQNAFKQARAIASMPGGQSQLMDAFAGQYMLPSGTAVGSGGTPGAEGQLNDMRMGWGGNAPIMPTPQVVPPGGMYAPPPVPGTVPPPPPGGVVTPQPVGPPVTTRPPEGVAPENYGMWNVQHPGYIKTGPGENDYKWIGQPGSTEPPPPLTGAAADTVAGSTYSPPGVQAPVGAWNYSATADNTSVSSYPPGVASPPQTADVSSYVPVNPASVAPVVNSAYQYGGAPNAAGLSAPVSGQTESSYANPNQINAQNYENAYQYQRDLLWAGYEDQGWDKNLAQESFLKSLPKYSGPSKGAIAF